LIQRWKKQCLLCFPSKLFMYGSIGLLSSLYNKNFLLHRSIYYFLYFIWFSYNPTNVEYSITYKRNSYWNFYELGSRALHEFLYSVQLINSRLHYNNSSDAILQMNLDIFMNNHLLLISNLYRILMTTCINWLCKLNKFENIVLTQTYSIYLNSIINLLSIIYINSNFYIFTKNFNSTMKSTKYKMDPLNKPLFISLQNT
jgi:hypothetical protein